MTTLQKANKSWQWNRRYNTTTDQDNIITLVDNNPSVITTAYPSLTAPLWTNGFIKEWKVYSEIYSLTEAPFPNLQDTSSDNERLAAVLNVEWGSPRFHFCVWSTTKNNPSNRPSAGDWVLEGKHSILHPAGYPYRIYYPLDLLTNSISREVGEAGKFGFSIENAGYGYPTNQDVIVTSGQWTQELVYLAPDPTPVVVYVTGGSSSGAVSAPLAASLTLPTGITTAKALDNTQIAIAVQNMTPSTAFTLKWFKGSTEISSESLTSDSAGKYTGTKAVADNPSIFSSSGNYFVRVTQGSQTIDSATVSVSVPFLTVSPSSFPNSNSGTFTGSGWNAGTVNIMYNKNGTDLPSTAYTVTADSSGNFTASISGTGFFFNGSLGVGTDKTYKMKGTQGTYSAYSNTYQVT